MDTATLRIEARKDKYGHHLMIDDGDPARPLYRSAMPNADTARLLAAAPALLAALKALVNMQKGRENWPEVKAAEAAIAATEPKPLEADHEI